MQFIKGILDLFTGASSDHHQSQSASMSNPVSHQSNQNQANPQFNTYYYQPNNIAQHGHYTSPFPHHGAPCGTSGYTGMNAPQSCQPPQPSATPGLPAPSVPEDPTSIVQWVRSSPKKCTELEGRAIVGGYSIKGADLWVIRTAYEGELLPAALNYGTKDAFVAYKDTEQQIYVFEVACAPANRVQWIESSHGKVPPNAVVGGKTKDGEKLYVGRAYHSKSLCPGKIQQSHGAIYVSFGYKAYAYPHYEVMCIV